MPKGKSAARACSKQTRRRRNTCWWHRVDWVQFGLMVAQIVSTIATLVQAIRH